MYVKTSLASPLPSVVVPRCRRFCCFALLIRRWRLWPQLRTTLPVAVRPKRFFAPLLVFSLGISVSLANRCGGKACPMALSRGPPPLEAAGYSDRAGRKQSAVITLGRASADGGPAFGTRHIA